MADEKPKVDEFGIRSFTLTSEGGLSYTLERIDGSKYIFVTIKDTDGRAIGKKVVDTTKEENKNVLNMYEDYVKDCESK